MRRCPISFEFVEEGTYSDKGLKMLSPRLRRLEYLSYTSSGLRREARARAGKMSIQGVQPKLSAVLKVAKGSFEVVSTGGRFIFKPQISDYPNVPENEDISMRLAKLAGIDVPLHGMVYTSDGGLCYFIKRFDREPKGRKRHVEDFTQLIGRTRDTKYDSSVEQVIGAVQKYCTFPKVELMKLHRRLLFSFLIGNEDAHLKNYSIIRRGGKVELSPAYDLLNTSVVLENAREETALPIARKKSGLNRGHFVSYLGKERMNLNEAIITRIDRELRSALPRMLDLLDISFLPVGLKDSYTALLMSRAERLGLGG